MSRIPGSSSISSDIEEVRHADDDDKSLVGGDFNEMSVESGSQDSEADESAPTKRNG